jgi:hypothetical protein
MLKAYLRYLGHDLGGGGECESLHRSSFAGEEQDEF